METVQLVLAFGMVCLASYLVGEGFRRLRLPAITGYLAAGALAGSFGLDLFPSGETERLRFVDEIALATIAFVAGSELYVNELRARLRPILLTTGGILASGFTLIAVAVYLLTAALPFAEDWGTPLRVATALLGGAVLLALSPPSTIAVIKELRARGPFTRTALGVTILMDVAIIVLFAVTTSIAAALLTGQGLNIGFVGLLALDLGAAVVLGLAAGQVLRAVLGTRAPAWAKTAAVLALGYGIYALARTVRETSAERLGFEVYIEPLLIALIAGFIVTNRTRYRDEFDALLHHVGPAVYVAFFTITGLSLQVDVLVATLPFALALFAVRALGIGIGSAAAATVAGEPPRNRRVTWMAFITQAGIALGLAREAAVQFPTLGDAFATLIISVVIVNEIAGPLFLRFALRSVGEVHLPEGGPEPEGRGALVLGVESQTMELARALTRQGWDVVVADPDAEHVERLAAEDVDERHIPEVSDAVLDGLITDGTAAVVALLPDDEDNLRALRFAYERHGIDRLVVRPAGTAHLAAFDDLGAFVVDPGSAFVTLLEQSVRAPQSTELLLRRDPDRTVAQVTVTNPDVSGTLLRDLRLPNDVLLLAVSRDGDTVVPTGHTELRRGDDVTLLAEPATVDEVRMRLED